MNEFTVLDKGPVKYLGVAGFTEGRTEGALLLAGLQHGDALTERSSRKIALQAAEKGDLIMVDVDGSGVNHAFVDSVPWLDGQSRVIELRSAGHQPGLHTQGT